MGRNNSHCPVRSAATLGCGGMDLDGVQVGMRAKGLMSAREIGKRKDAQKLEGRPLLGMYTENGNNNPPITLQPSLNIDDDFSGRYGRRIWINNMDKGQLKNLESAHY